jgi:hypothetical protein
MHIASDGQPAYIGAYFAWCGNFQSGRCVVRLQGDGPPRFAHIKPNGTVLGGGPYAYVGDFREVRCR